MEVAKRSNILFEDNHLLIVNKPAGILSQGDNTGDKCLIDFWKAFIAKRDKKEGNVFLGLPHRLDRPVSGVMVLSKTSKALERLNKMFQDKEIQKTYWALGEGMFKDPTDSGVIENYMRKDSATNKSQVVKPNKAGAKVAITNWKLLAVYDTQSLFELEPKTGRSHQLRLHMAKTLNSIIVGDVKYGARRPTPDKSICLHARKVEFIHPVKKVKVTVLAPLPIINQWDKVKETFPSSS